MNSSWTENVSDRKKRLRAEAREGRREEKKQGRDSVKNKTEAKDRGPRRKDSCRRIINIRRKKSEGKRA